MRYVVVYISDRIIQGHRFFWLAYKVNILSQEKVQRIMPIYHLQFSTVALYH